MENMKKRGCTKETIRGKKGVSPLIASVLSILFGIMMLAIVLTVIQPTFKRAKDSSTISDIFQNLQLLNSAIKEVSSEARGSKRTITLSISGGEYRINSTYDWIYATYEPESDLRLTGTKGDIKIDTGLEFADYFNWYVDGSLAEPHWTNTSGQWYVSSLKYLGTNGTAYMNITPRPIENFEFSGTVTNISGPTGGQIFVLPIPPENLVGYWTFDDRGSDKAYDYSGNNNTGTLTNMNTTGNSTSGWQSSSDCSGGTSCLMFDGVNDYVNTGYTTTLGTNDDFSIGLWVKTGTKSSSQVLAGFGSTTSNWNRIQLDLDINGNLRFYVRDDSGNANSYREVSLDLTDSSWHYVVGTWDGSSDTATLYIDGNLKGLDSTNSLGSITISHALVVGALNNNGATNEYFTGFIDEVMIFNRALTAEEVKALYEMSFKKIYGGDGSQNIGARTNASLVLSNPAGQSKFDDIKITRDGNNKMSFVIPYSKVDLNGTLRLQKGEHRIQIIHMGINSTSGKPIIEISVS